MDISLFFFADDAASEREDPYRLLLDGARLADEAGLAAVWTPERHFHRFGGLYPSPAVTGAAVAAVTRNIGVRAGSVVLPLHDPVRVAEEWSMIDNLSGGRAGVSIASGWHAGDFALHPDPRAGYESRKETMIRSISQLRRLWRGEKVERTGGAGDQVELEIFPKPVQPELPLWVTSSGNPATFELAGSLGGNVLTHLLAQAPGQLAENIARYRDSWRSDHPDVPPGKVTVMVHTLLGPDDDSVRELIREPFSAYLAQSIDLISKSAPTTGNRTVREADRRVLVERSFDRYTRDSGLFGSLDSARQMCASLLAAGVDEVACLVDFGVPRAAVMRGLELLADLAVGVEGVVR